MFTTNEQRGRALLAIALIALGVLSLANNLVSGGLSTWIWIAGFAVAAVGFGWYYRQSDEGWALLGMYITGGLAVLILLVTQFNLEGNLIPTLVLLAIAIPFIVGWRRDPKQWGLLIPAYVLIAIIPVLYLDQGGNSDNLVPAYVLTVIGLPFIAGYLFTRQWPLLIPGGIMLAIAAFFVLGATDATAQAFNILLALAFIGAGAVLLLRGGRGPDKPKREEE